MPYCFRQGEIWPQVEYLTTINFTQFMKCHVKITEFGDVICSFWCPGFFIRVKCQTRQSMLCICYWRTRHAAHNNRHSICMSRGHQKFPGTASKLAGEALLPHMQGAELCWTSVVQLVLQCSNNCCDVHESNYCM